MRKSFVLLGLIALTCLVGCSGEPSPVDYFDGGVTVTTHKGLFSDSAEVTFNEPGYFDVSFWCIIDEDCSAAGLPKRITAHVTNTPETREVTGNFPTVLSVDIKHDGKHEEHRFYGQAKFD